MELDKFVESPSRPGKPAVDVFISNADDISVKCPTGETGSAGEVISAVKAIYTDGVSLFLGDANTDFQHASIVGVSLTAATIGNELRYQIDGQMFDSSFSFTDGEPVYLDLNGGLTQTDPDLSGHSYRVLIGYATGTGGLHINIQEPIIL